MIIQRTIVDGKAAVCADMPNGYVKILFDDGTMIIGRPADEVKKYSPDQPRDPDGKFGFGDGTPSKTKSEIHGSQTDTPAFKQWFGNSKVVDENGKPLVVYHGTLGDFTAFSPQFASPESDMGKGHYFTSSIDDVNKDYANEQGPDMRNRVSALAESLSDVNNSGLDKDAVELAKQQLGWVNGGAVLPVYLSMQNPVVIGKNPPNDRLDNARNEETQFTFEEKYDEDGEPTGEITGTLEPMLDGLREAASETNDERTSQAVDEVADNIRSEAMDNGGYISAGKVVELFRGNDDLLGSQDEEGRMNSNDILRQGFQNAGYDGIIDNTVSTKFGAMGLSPDTTHYIAFNPKQIKSAIGNRGTFDPKDADITKLTKYSDDEPRDDHGKWTAGGGSEFTYDAKTKQWTGGTAKENARLQALRVPPAWKNVRLNPDPNGDKQAMGVDKKGRTQAIYSATFRAGQDAAKFERLKAFNKVVPQAVQKFKADMNNKSLDKATRDSAAASYLMSQTGIRIGSTKETGAEKQAYGASTLEGRHVEIDGSFVTLNFTGKKGVEQSVKIEDASLAKYMGGKDAGKNDKVFGDTNDAHIRDYFHNTVGDQFVVKDFRTWTGTATALRTISGMKSPQTQTDYKKAVRTVAKAVSEKLGNTPAIALKSYIDPTVFKSWNKKWAA